MSEVVSAGRAIHYSLSLSLLLLPRCFERSAESSDSLKKELKNTVREIIGPFASPDSIHWAPALPKTRSGKIMRRILRKIASGDYDQLGDTSTLADPSVVDTLISLKGK